MSDEWKPDYTKTPRRIVCAANRKHGRIVTGARHCDKVMRAQIIAAEGLDWWKGGDVEQGFIDQFGDFLTREEAHVIAKEQGQIRRRCGGDEHRLYSENLY